MADSYKHVVKGAGKLKLKLKARSKSAAKPKSQSTEVAPSSVPKDGSKLERAVASSITRDPEEIVRGRKRARAEAAASTKKSSSADADGAEELPSSLTAAERAFIKHSVKHTVRHSPSVCHTLIRTAFITSQEKRELAKKARMSHRERIDEMNSYLANLPVHNDVPKTAAAGLG